jgi:hypothetical protein
VKIRLIRQLAIAIVSVVLALGHAVSPALAVQRAQGTQRNGSEVQPGAQVSYRYDAFTPGSVRSQTRLAGTPASGDNARSPLSDRACAPSCTYDPAAARTTPLHFVATKSAVGVVDDHIVLGKSIGLEQTAGKVGGRTLMNDPNWQQSVLDAISTPGTKITVALDGVPGASVRTQVMSVVQRGASGAGAPFDWEMAQLYQAGRLSGVTFVQGGKVVANPFG